MTDEKKVPLEEKIALRKSLQQMVDSEGFRAYISMIAEQKQIRLNHLFLTPLESVDKAFAQEYVKGEYQGLSIAEALPQQLIEDLSADIDHELKEIRNENE